MIVYHDLLFFLLYKMQDYAKVQIFYLFISAFSLPKALNGMISAYRHGKSLFMSCRKLETFFCRTEFLPIYRHVPIVHVANPPIEVKFEEKKMSTCRYHVV